MKAAVEHILQKFGFTKHRACRLLLNPVSSYRGKRWPNDNSLRERRIALAREKPRFGYQRLPSGTSRVFGPMAQAESLFKDRRFRLSLAH